MNKKYFSKEESLAANRERSKRRYHSELSEIRFLVMGNYGTSNSYALADVVAVLVNHPKVSPASSPSRIYLEKAK